VIGGQNSNKLCQSGQEDGYEAIKIDNVEHVEPGIIHLTIYSESK